MITELHPRPERHHFKAAHIRRSFETYLRRIQPRFYSQTRFEDIARIAREKRRNGELNRTNRYKGHTTPVDAALEDAQRRLEEEK